MVETGDWAAGWEQWIGPTDAEHSTRLARSTQLNGKAKTSTLVFGIWNLEFGISLLRKCAKGYRPSTQWRYQWPIGSTNTRECMNDTARCQMHERK
jgi:hypothetical protein